MVAVLKEANFHIRRMSESDLDGVMVGENASYATPWNEGIFRDCLATGYHGFVLEQAERIAGHAMMSVAVGEAHILNLCIYPEFQARGLGRRLLQRLLDHAASMDADTAFLEVRASNRLAIALYESEGFNEIGERRGYYPAAVHGGEREDALVMALSIVPL